MSNAAGTAPIQDLAVIDATAELVVRRPPALVLEEAHKAAVALEDVLDKKPKPVMMNGERYLEFEDWQTIGRFYGITAKVTSTAYVKYGDVYGPTAHAVALRSDGYELSAADADCLNDEEKWRSKARYEWRDGEKGRERAKVGEEPVPLFQLKSMAQTRACAKVFRAVLAWVVVLAGYRPTPAEELEGVVDGEVAKPARPAETQKPTPSGSQPTAPLADGTTTVKDVKATTGKKNDKAWTRYGVTFADGRKASTFDKKLGEACEVAAGSHESVNPEIEKGEKGDDLRGLKPTVATRPLEPEVARGPEEPVDGPEKVLTARKLTRADQSVYYIVCANKRELYTPVEALAQEAVAARKAGLGVVPSFTVAPWPGVEGRKVNVLAKLVVEHSEVSEEIAAGPSPTALKAAAEIESDMSAEDDREPGSDG